MAENEINCNCSLPLSPGPSRTVPFTPPASLGPGRN